MTLWQVLVVVAVAWFSGALFGVGWKDFRAGRGRAKPAAKFDALAAALEAPPSPPSPASEPGAPVAGGETDRPQRPQFWFVDEGAAAETVEETSPAVAERSAAEPVLNAELAAPPPPTPTGAVEAPLFDAPAEAEATEPSATKPKTTRLGAEPDSIGANTVSSVRKSDEPFVMPPPGRLKKKGGKQSAVAKQIAYWRAQDRAAQSRGFMFWVEIAVLILLLVGASWGVVYFATQPVAGLR